MALGASGKPDYAFNRKITSQNRRFALDGPRTPHYSPPQWAIGRKVWQGTVTPSRRLTPGSIPGSPTIFLCKFNTMRLAKKMVAPRGFGRFTVKIANVSSVFRFVETNPKDIFSKFVMRQSDPV
jgi:hypothetical protein